MTAAETVSRCLAYGIGFFSFIFSLLSVFAAKRFHQKSAESRENDGAEFLPPITILKPIKGVDRSMYGNLASFLSQDYPKFQVLFAIQNPEDPALEILARLRKNFPRVDMEIVVSKNRIGYNPKVNNLANAYPLAKYDFLVISDSDIRVEPDLLRRIIPPMRNPSMGLLTCLYRSETEGSLGCIIEALSINSQFLPKALVAGFLLRLQFSMGAVMLVRRAAFEASGGFLNLSHHLADDHVLGQSIFNAGYEMGFADAVVTAIPNFHSFSDALSHLIRWARTIRIIEPLGYLGLLMLQGLPVILLHLLIFGPRRGLIALGAAVLLARIASVAWIHRSYLGSRRIGAQLAWLPLADAIQFGIWILGFRSERVHWRGEQYEIASNGSLLPINSKRRRPSPAGA